MPLVFSADSLKAIPKISDEVGGCIDSPGLSEKDVLQNEIPKDN
jgi:hypothetical protein